MDPYLHIKHFPDGRIGTVIPLTYGRARITIGTDLILIDNAW